MNRLHVTFALLGLGLLGSTLGIWFVHADESKPAAITKVKTLAETTAILQQPCGLELPPQASITVDDLFNDLAKKHDVLFRLDPAVFSKANGFTNMLETKISGIRPGGLSVRDLLECICEELNTESSKFGIHAKAGQILITLRFMPATTPGRYKLDTPPTMIPEDQIAHLLYGPTVSITVTDKSLTDMVNLLREQTGANIVFDPRCGDLANKKLTLTLNDAKLRTVLKLAASLCDLGVAVVDNAFIVTEAALAEQLMTETELNLFGEPPAKKKK